jgi:hypothetical protein
MAQVKAEKTAARSVGVSRSDQEKKQASAASDLWPGQSVPLLKALHILTHNGGLNADSRRKLKQVQHLAQLIKPAIDGALQDKDQPVLADLGAGKSYLGFILYDLYLAPAGRGKVIAVEARADLTETAKRIAAESGVRMDFALGKIADAEVGPVDIVTALHACDTATDEAILFALRHEAKYVALVPCCQAEVARQLQDTKGPLDQLWRHGIQRPRQFGLAAGHQCHEFGVMLQREQNRLVCRLIAGV